MSLKIIKWPEFLKSDATKKCAITIGVFDGVHKGHQALIECIVKRGPNPTVITFSENPKKVISGSFEGDLYSLKQKLEIFESLGVREVVLIDFSYDFSKLKGRDFLNLLESSGKMAFLAIGSNFRCGRAQDTSADLIREMNFSKGIPTELIPPVADSPAGNELVSSSRVRSAVVSGNLELAAALLGRRFCLDLSDITPLYSQAANMRNKRESRKVYIYDLRSVQRIIPANGLYDVLKHPGRVRSILTAEDGKVFIPQKADSIEFGNH